MTVGFGQNLTLLAGNVINTGTLSAPGGTITVASVPGESIVRIAQAGHLLNLEVAGLDEGAGESVAGVEPLSLPGLLTGEIGSQVATGVEVNAEGQMVLTGSPTVIPAAEATTIIAGTLDVSQNLLGVNHVPSVSILGQQVGVIQGTINASGVAGGGVIRIGGDLQGNGNLPNAVQTFVSRDSVIKADALESGNAGTVIIWAEDSTRFLGNISAQGGMLQGDGGFVEVSGKQTLDFRGGVNTWAPNGLVGTLLLDPTDITIQNGAGSFTDLTQVDQFADPNIASLNEWQRLTSCDIIKFERKFSEIIC